MAVVETQDLRKRYRRIEALGGVTLKVEKGEIYGLLGQNGAGKTTLIKILLGITRGWEGQARLLEEPVGTVRIRSRVGYLPEDHRFPDYHSGWSLLDYYGQLLGVPRPTRQRRIPEILELVGISERRHYKIRTYSKGMKQRLGVAQALMHEPEVVFLDEPTDGVDPVGRRDIREMLLKLKDQGCTIFINSHLLGEVELVCDRVAILRRGFMIREGSVAELTQEKGRFLIGLAPEQKLPVAELKTLGYVVDEVVGPRWEVQLDDHQNIDAIVDLIRARGLNLRHLVEKRQTLEDLFLATHAAERPDRKRRGSADEEHQNAVEERRP